MKPGLPHWAKNNAYAAAPGAPNPTKAPPSAGQIADGYQPDAAVSPQIWNYWRWAAATLLASCSSMRLLNWQEADTTVLAAGVYGVGNGMYEPVSGSYVYDCANGAIGPGTPQEGLSWDSGLTWVAGAAPGGVTYDLTAGAGCRSAHDNVGNRVIVNREPGIGANPMAICYSPAWGPWDLTWGGTVIPAMTPSLVEHDHLAGPGRWVIGDSFAAGGNELWVSPGPGTAWINPAAMPGFAFAFSVLAHSHHPAGLLYPDDPGNQVWVTLTKTEWSTSLTGWIWTPAALHGWAGAPTPLDIGYSAYGTRWIVTLSDGANAKIAVSDDNFTTSSMKPALGVPGCPINSAIVNPSYFKIACDDFGDWLVAILDPAGGDFELHASWDNGESFTRLHLPGPLAPDAASACDVWYGGGRFVLWLDEATGPSHQVFISLRSAG